MNTRRDLDRQSALVLLSGGQDSTTCLFWALEQFTGKVEAVAFNYGQRHRVELQQAQKIADLAGVPLRVIHAPGLGGSTLTDQEGSTDTASEFQENLPSSFTPARNAVFLTLAAGLAYRRGMANLVTGVCQTDYSGYPDCRQTFIQAQQAALSLALDADLHIHAPLMYLTKAETWKLAADLGCLQTVVEHSHTDYHGDRTERHEWGYGRMDNPATRLRAQGWEEAKRRGWVK